jgi:hypothetical protein
LRLVGIGQVHHAHPLPSGVRVSLVVGAQQLMPTIDLLIEIQSCVLLLDVVKPVYDLH